MSRSARIPFRILMACLVAATCALAAKTPPETKNPPAPPKFRAGTIDAPAIKESSGLVASRRHEGVFWTVNDSDNPAVLYAITLEGKLIVEYAVDAKNVDWEDLAIDDGGHVYIADVGNNFGKRAEVQVLRIDEPDPRTRNEGRDAPPAPLKVGATWRLTYPNDKPFDCEGLVVLDGKGYLISKHRDGDAAQLYRFDLKKTADPVRLEHVGGLPIRAPVTAADVSADGKRLAVLTLLGPYMFEINGDVASAATDAPLRYSRYVHPITEAACFIPGGLLVTAESREVFFFADAFFKAVDRPARPGAEGDKGDKPAPPRR